MRTYGAVYAIIIGSGVRMFVDMIDGSRGYIYYIVYTIHILLRGLHLYISYDSHIRLTLRSIANTGLYVVVFHVSRTISFYMFSIYRSA